jgi:hypothetical protein
MARWRLLNAFPERGDSSQQVQIGDLNYTLRLWWGQKARTWYMDLSDLDGNPVVVGRPLLSGARPLPGASGVEGIVLGVGVDYNTPDALGRDIQVLVVDRFDLPERD